MAIPGSGLSGGILLAYNHSISLCNISMTQRWIMEDLYHNAENTTFTFIGAYGEPKKENKCSFLEQLSSLDNGHCGFCLVTGNLNMVLH